MDNLHKANVEEEAAKRALNNYIGNLEDDHGRTTSKMSTSS